MSRLRSTSPTIDFETDPDTITTKDSARRKSNTSTRTQPDLSHENSAHSSTSIPRTLQEDRDRTVSPPRKTKLPEAKNSQNYVPANASNFRCNMEIVTTERRSQNENTSRELENRGSYRERQTSATNYDSPSHARDHRNYPTYGRGNTSYYDRCSSFYSSNRGRPVRPYTNGYTVRRDRNRNRTWNSGRQNFEQSKNRERIYQLGRSAISTQTDFEPVPKNTTPEISMSRSNVSSRPQNQNVNISTAFATGFAFALQIVGAFQKHHQPKVPSNLFVGVTAPFFHRSTPLAIAMPEVPKFKQSSTGAVSTAALLTTKTPVGNYQLSSSRKTGESIAEKILKDLTTCRKCFPYKIFKRRGQATFHMSQMHGSRFCPICRLPFKIKGTELKEHFLTEHTKGNRDEKAACPVCQNRYCFDTMRNHVANHLKQIEGNQVKTNENCSVEHCGCCAKQEKYFKDENKSKILQPEKTRCASNRAINRRSSTEMNERPMDSFEELD